MKTYRSAYITMVRLRDVASGGRGDPSPPPLIKYDVLIRLNLDNVRECLHLSFGIFGVLMM